MFAPSIQLEYVSFYIPDEDVWREETVKVPSSTENGQDSKCMDEDFEDFCRRSIL
ncbi:conserved hypothetical protein [Solidesulfovibrio fructosivorans JJ]]|uniref:Uncharacterized protein n=1 Tax=Solidesulfovibrio fructosivorans JJ] TaxID=596151 RepID=E1JX63_SOLFR|nr:hypothetical protein [Solidesulfovibrio fructosivorans]EFL51028.1 conserved hypothetical protein [Solidesulfovibrio fructosivorans JJ]]